MIQIHGKNYITVAERIEKAKQDVASINTEVLFTEPRVVIKATVTMKNGNVFTGLSAANSSKMIEKESPFEVAETSAVGRALAFAGYETTGGIASAEEIVKAEAQGECEHINTSDYEVKTEGKNKGRWYKVCNDCKTDGKRTFIGWIEKPEVPEL